jgi:hypothetical protein
VTLEVSVRIYVSLLCVYLPWGQKVAPCPVPYCILAKRQWICMRNKHMGSTFLTFYGTTWEFYFFPCMTNKLLWKERAARTWRSLNVEELLCTSLDAEERWECA